MDAFLSQKEIDELLGMSNIEINKKETPIQSNSLDELLHICKHGINYFKKPVHVYWYIENTDTISCPECHEVIFPMKHEGTRCPKCAQELDIEIFIS